MEHVIVYAGRTCVSSGPLGYELQVVSAKLSYRLCKGEKVTLMRKGHEVYAWRNQAPVEYEEILKWAFLSVCRYCGVENPWCYFAPRHENGTKSVICYDCASSKQWLGADGQLRPDVHL